MAGNVAVRHGLHCDRCDCVLQEFAKAGASTLYMPVWSWSELDAGRHLHGLEENEILPLYRKWGGSARYVLQLAREPDRQDELESAIAKANLDAIYKAVGDVDSADEVGWAALPHFLLLAIRLTPCLIGHMSCFLLQLIIGDAACFVGVPPPTTHQCCPQLPK